MAQAAQLQQATEETKTVSLPGWNSIIAVPRGPKPTKDQLKEYYRAKREHRDPDLPREVVDEIERRRNIRDRIQSSTTPETAKQWTNIVTWLDNAQDLFSLVAFGGRLAARVMPKILGRFIPGLGWILLGADILKLLTLLTGLIQPFFVAMCHGWSKGVSAALPPLLTGNAAKLAGHGIAALNPFSRSAQLARQAKFAGRLFRVGETLEMAQAMQTITGYGLTLGGIMGTITESAYALELAARGEHIGIATESGAKVYLKGGDLTAYSPGSATGLSAVYEAVSRITSDPQAAATMREKARALRTYGQ